MQAAGGIHDAPFRGRPCAGVSRTELARRTHRESMKTNPFFRVTAALLALLLLAISAGCNTAKGFGEDVERGGEAVQDAAD